MIGMAIGHGREHVPSQALAQDDGTWTVAHVARQQSPDFIEDAFGTFEIFRPKDIKP